GHAHRQPAGADAQGAGLSRTVLRAGRGGRALKPGAAGPAPSEAHVKAAVDRDVGAGDVAGVVVAAEGDDARDLVAAAKPADLHAVDDALADLLGNRHHHRGVAIARRPRVDRDALARHLARQRHGEAVHPGLGRRVVGLAELTGLAIDRADVDDATEAARDHS